MPEGPRPRIFSDSLWYPARVLLRRASRLARNVVRYSKREAAGERREQSLRLRGVQAARWQHSSIHPSKRGGDASERPTAVLAQRNPTHVATETTTGNVAAISATSGIALRSALGDSAPAAQIARLRSCPSDRTPEFLFRHVSASFLLVPLCSPNPAWTVMCTVYSPMPAWWHGFSLFPLDAPRPDCIINCLNFAQLDSC